jgi:hypothetical protein
MTKCHTAHREDLIRWTGLLGSVPVDHSQKMTGCSEGVGGEEGRGAGVVAGATRH